MAHLRHGFLGANIFSNSDSYEFLESSQNSNGQEKPPKNSDPVQQTWRLFRKQSFRLFTTCVFAALFLTTLKIYEKKGNINKNAMRVFNAMTICLTLILSLNFFEAFKDMAKVLRWRVLARRHHTVREVDLILGAHSLQTLFTLMWESRKKYLTVLVCMIWISLNIIAQALIGTIGLMYSIESGTDSTGVVLQEGPVNVPQLDCYYYNGQCTNASVFSTPQHLAHAYGETIQGQQTCNYTQDSDIQSASQDCYYFRHTNGQEFAFRYSQYNPKDSARAYPYLTDRIVKASASECFQYTVAKKPEKIDSPDGDQDTWLWSFHNSTFNGKIAIPRRDAT
ncbi:hypothetical protein MMC29_001575, partial [Sticta canariensis]|nr:hypothetical protein [Sticta canariensis]